MSYKLNNSNWQSVLSPGGVGFPVKYGTWQFLEYAHEEEIHNTIVSMIGSSYNPNIVYILWGCTLSTSGGNTIISSGAIFYQGSNLIGEVYSVYGNTITTPSGGNVVVCNLLISNYIVTSGLGNAAADPVVFTNGSSLNVHNVRTMAIGSGASGSGTISGDSYSDFTNLVNYGSWIEVPIGSLNMFTITGSVSINSLNYCGYKIINNKTVIFQLDAVITASGTSIIELETFSIFGTAKNTSGAFYFNGFLNAAGSLVCAMDTVGKNIKINYSAGFSVSGAAISFQYIGELF